MHRTIKSATYTPQSHRTDNEQHSSGDVTYVQFVECGHVMLGNPIYTFRVGDKTKCWQCDEEYTRRIQLAQDVADEIEAARK